MTGPSHCRRSREHNAVRQRNHLSTLLEVTAVIAAICAAYNSGGYTLRQIGEPFGLHYSHLFRVVKKQKARPEPEALWLASALFDVSACPPVLWSAIIEGGAVVLYLRWRSVVVCIWYDLIFVLVSILT